MSRARTMRRVRTVRTVLGEKGEEGGSLTVVAVVRTGVVPALPERSLRPCAPQIVQDDRAVGANAVPGFRCVPEAWAATPIERAPVRWWTM